MDIRSLVLQGTDTLRKNQYPTGKVGSFDFNYVMRNKQLIVKSQARPSSGESYSAYQSQIVFSGVGYSDVPSPDFPLTYNSPNGKIYLQKPTTRNTVQIRCSCKDDYFMWQYPNKSKGALLGRFKPYVRKTADRPPRNPGNVPGMCKHTLALVKNLFSMGVLQPDSQVQEYLSRPTRSI